LARCEALAIPSLSSCSRKVAWSIWAVSVMMKMLPCRSAVSLVIIAGAIWLARFCTTRSGTSPSRGAGSWRVQHGAHQLPPCLGAGQAAHGINILVMASPLAAHAVGMGGTGKQGRKKQGGRQMTRAPVGQIIG
jgi:glucose dehydrogenase